MQPFKLPEKSIFHNDSESINFKLQSWPKKFVLGCVISPLRQQEESRNLGHTFLTYSVIIRDYDLQTPHFVQGHHYFGVNVLCMQPFKLPEKYISPTPTPNHARPGAASLRLYQSTYITQSGFRALRKQDLNLIPTGLISEIRQGKNSDHLDWPDSGVYHYVSSLNWEAGNWRARWLNEHPESGQERFLSEHSCRL